MFSIFKRQSTQRNEAPDSKPPETDPQRMTLAERMAYRREMLYQSIRESLLQLQAISSMYKFRVMNLDARHHRFVVMIEVTSSFDAKMDGMSVGFNQIEEFIKTRASESFGISLESIFWRVNEIESSFASALRAGDGSTAASRDMNTARQREVPEDVTVARQRLARAQVAPASQDNSQPGAISVKDMDYETEQGSLQAAEPTVKTEYGQL